MMKSTIMLSHYPLCSSLSLGVEDFLLERVRLGEADFDFVGGIFAVDLSNSVELVLNLLLVEGVQVDSDVLLAIEGHSGGSASDGGGVHL